MDKYDPRVRQFLKGIDEDLEKKRNALERPNKTETETAFLRGYIKALRDITASITRDPDEDNDEPSS